MYACTVVASNTVVEDPQQARRVGNASIGLSIAGIVVTVVVVIILVAVYTTDNKCIYYKYGTCYSSRDYIGSFDTCCYGVKYGDYMYCYYGSADDDAAVSSTTPSSSGSSCNYVKYGTCYSSRNYIGYSGTCYSGVKYGGYCYYGSAAVSSTTPRSSSCPSYKYYKYGTCYSSRTYIGSSGTCYYGVKYGSYCYSI